MLTIFKYLFHPKGRIGRNEYTIGIFLLGIIYLICSFFDFKIYNYILIINLYIFIIISIKRFHDINMSGFFVLIPGINIILCIILSGNKKDNQYGKVSKIDKYIELTSMKISDIGHKIFNLSFIIFISGIIGLIIYFFIINGITVWVDNPTKQPIFVKINLDGKEKEIKPKTSLRFSVNNGENEIFLNGKSVGIINKDFFDMSFVNPTLSIYISEYTLYVNENINPGNYYDKLPNNIIKIFENEIVGPFKKYEGLLINGTWDYGFGDMSNKTDEEIEGLESQKYEIKEKLYRLDEFIDMYNKEYSEK